MRTPSRREPSPPGRGQGEGRRTRRNLAAASLLALLTACAPPSPILAGATAGPVDPERIRAASDDAAGTNCTPHKRASLPVTLPGLIVVPAAVNGRPAQLIFDTGAELSLLTTAAAKRLGVTTQYDFNRQISGIGSTVAAGDARLDSLRLGAASVPYPRALVGNVRFDLGPIEADGLLGSSLLDDFDMDIDLAHRRIDLYDKLDCADPHPVWPGPYTTVETTRSLTRHPTFPLSVDGRTISASLDSGSQRTVLSSATAARLGIGDDTRVPGPAMHVRGAAGEVLPASMHTLRDVRIGTVRLRGPVQIVPAALPRDLDALVGLDFLLQNRVWLSYASRRIFIQPG